MSAGHIKIGPEFFSKAKNDYNDWHWAWVREIMQNSIDCGSTKIDVTITKEDGNTKIVVANNGEPMTEDVLLNKLLSLGSSGKNFQGSVGGFGKAKELLYYSHLEYTIRTGTHEVTGSGATYELHSGLPNHYGTTSIVIMEGDVTGDIKPAFHRFARYAQWRGMLTVDGSELDTDLRKGSPRRDLGFGTVYTNKSYHNKLIVRIGGIPMFYDYVSLDRCVIVELNGSSLDCLTANRDGLLGKYRYELSSFVTELAVDKRSALKNKGRTKYRHYDGRRLRHQLKKSVNIKALVAASSPTQTASPTGNGPTYGVASGEEILATLPIHGTSGEGLVSGTVSGGSGNITMVDVIGEAPARAADIRLADYEESAIQIGEEFVVKNETELIIPYYYLPESSEFSNYSRKLVQIWGRLMLEMHKTFDREASFAIGFIFDESAEAEYENGDYGEVFYLNPAVVVTQDNSQSRSFRKRFKLTERSRLISLAVHEFVHSQGYSMHDENYANKLTDAFAVVLEQKKRFNWCFANLGDGN